MKNKAKVKFYPPLEEKINIVTHEIGAIASLVALLFLINKALTENKTYLLSVVIYAVCVFLLFLASTLYHSTKSSEKRLKLKVFDHAAIYLMIAGTYTPFCLVTLSDSIGLILFLIVWSLAAIGLVLKVFFAGRFSVLSTIAYVVMGWIILFAYKPLSENLKEDGLFWLVTGGVSFTIGALLYLIPKLKFNHALFHVFVLIGAACHFISIYYYL